jgi:hypothetical protein
MLPSIFVCVDYNSGSLIHTSRRLEYRALRKSYLGIPASYKYLNYYLFKYVTIHMLASALFILILFIVPGIHIAYLLLLKRLSQKETNLLLKNIG